MAALDELSRNEGAWTDGMEAGMEEGMEAGMEKGMEAGMERGMEKEREEVARNGLAKGYPIETLSDLTGLSAAAIKKLASR